MLESAAQRDALTRIAAASKPARSSSVSSLLSIDASSSRARSAAPAAVASVSMAPPRRARRKAIVLHKPARRIATRFFS